jgi:acyl-CoA thioester hydrolase
VGRPFRLPLRVRWQDSDPQGILYFANHLAYFDVCLTELWREALGSYTAMVADGVDMVTAEANIRYLAPARFDSEVEVSAEITRLGTTGTAMRFQMRDGEALLSEGSMRHVFIKAGTTEKTPIPGRVREALAPYVTEAGG